MNIGVLDSGVGGLHILHYLQQQLPEHTYTFVADSAHFPYSEKPIKIVQDSITKLVSELIQQGNTIIVVACNTATVMAIQHLRERFPETLFVGTVPPIKQAHDHLPLGAEVLVLSTHNTAHSSYLAQLIASHNNRVNFTVVGTTQLVESVESGDTDAAVAELQRIKTLYAQTSFAGIVVGCTHFSALTNEIKEVFGNRVTLFEPQEGIKKRVEALVTTSTTVETPQ